MNKYNFQIFNTNDEEYGTAVAFSLPSYDASQLQHLRQAFPSFVCVSRNEKLVGVCGFRSGERGLFLEQFMDAGAKAYVAAHAGEIVAPEAIVELGAFRVASPALTPLFSANITRLLIERGFSHALALSATGPRSVEQWSRERAAIAAGKGSTPAAGSATPLQVSVIQLAVPR